MFSNIKKKRKKKDHRSQMYVCVCKHASACVRIQQEHVLFLRMGVRRCGGSSKVKKQRTLTLQETRRAAVKI